MKDCKNCIWFDQCHEEEACEHYSPVDQEEEDKFFYPVYTTLVDNKEEKDSFYGESLPL